MPGFVSSVSNDEDIVFAKNVDFSGAANPSNTITTDLQIIVGSTALNAGGTHVNILTLTEGEGIELTQTATELEIAANEEVATTYSTDSGNAIPSGNVLNVLGLSGSRTSGSGNTLVVKSPAYSNQALATTVLTNTGSFATGAITLTTPLALNDGDLLEFVGTNGVIVIQLQGGQVAHIGTVATSANGTLTSTNTGDAVCLRYQLSTNDFWATSSVGVWVLA